MLENKERTELKSLGEFGLINHLTEHVEIYNTSSIKGIGDDAAVIKYDNEKKIWDLKSKSRIFLISNIGWFVKSEVQGTTFSTNSSTTFRARDFTPEQFKELIRKSIHAEKFQTKLENIIEGKL